MRNEIWSLIAAKGAPSWYITLSPVDIRSPICVYYADTKEEFVLDLPSYDYGDRIYLISRNPVAAARFFNVLVKLFIKHILGVDGGHDGIYGKTSAYYGTVEQQGRLSLHLHLLLWIAGSLRPQDLRDRLKECTDFKDALIAYLEAAHQGELSTGSLSEVQADVEAKKVSKEKTGYKDPIDTLPAPPPCALCKLRCMDCNLCHEYQKWYNNYIQTTDDILLKSNVHRCRTNINKDGSKNKGRNYVGCTDNRWGKCKARFPRPVIESTKVDQINGTIFSKKKEPWLNTFTPVLSYLFRCNTDVTSLKSGTALKAVTLYVSNYITKSALKTHVIFDTIRSTFDRYNSANNTNPEREGRARELMVKMVNALTAKMELGAPMACMYLLGHPDHYTGHRFATFHWRPYFSEVRHHWTKSDEHDMDIDNPFEDKVMLWKSKGKIFPLSSVHDYIHRPQELEDWDLYTFISRCHRVKVRKDANDVDIDENHDDEHDDEVEPVSKSLKGLYQFQEAHPMYKTHRLSITPPKSALIPNFVGGTIPRADQGDYEYYCTTMLTLFHPWRSGSDLKNDVDSWNESFRKHTFSSEQQEIMKNFQIRYECLDAHDDSEVGTK
ncbi:hypothetical protein BDN72DRAFT_779679 [Pluteus cervinus]|uniref:Uncharacterized protein n=1 Tax=Pluteus cervinus TaxID=181527 RepID=A0ACD3A4K5_9AGAR|nr:hypothetical protein BDN72DRAFT_779679 [Pluteus cervinus]